MSCPYILQLIAQHLNSAVLHPNPAGQLFIRSARKPITINCCCVSTHQHSHVGPQASSRAVFLNSQCLLIPSVLSGVRWRNSRVKRMTTTHFRCKSKLISQLPLFHRNTQCIRALALPPRIPDLLLVTCYSAGHMDMVRRCSYCGGSEIPALLICSWWWHMGALDKFHL